VNVPGANIKAPIEGKIRVGLAVTKYQGGCKLSCSFSMEKAMKKLLLAGAISALTLPGAFACDYGHQADLGRTTVACSGGNCQANPPTTTPLSSTAAATNDADRVAEPVQPSLITLISADSAKAISQRPNDK
jgi:hypothetical protein